MDISISLTSYSVNHIALMAFGGYLPWLKAMFKPVFIGLLIDQTLAKNASLDHVKQGHYHNYISHA